MFEEQIKRSWGSLNYRSTGSGLRTIFLHDFGRSSDYYLRLISELEIDFSVTAPDLPGHGKSDIPFELTTIKTMARDIIELVSGALLGRIPFIAHGTGGILALEVLRQAPHLCSKLILLDTFLPPSKRKDIFGEDLIPYKNREEFLSIRNTFKGWRINIRDDYIITINAYNFSWLTDNANTEILFLYGDRGRAERPEDLTDLPSRNQHYTYWLSDCGHEFPVTEYELTAHIIRRFLLENSTDFSPPQEPEPETDMPPPSLGELMFR